MKINDEEITIKRLGPDDVKNFIGLIGLFHEVFETYETGTVDEPYLTRLLENPDFIAFAIFRNGNIAGGATAYMLPMYSSKSSELFIYDVAIHSDYQRSGLGKKLISTLKNFCQQNSIGEMFVPAHEDDIHALNFYKATGGKAERVVHFNYSTKE
jgi:aminoglycoside 3-N-acetyltransferase I